MDALAAIGWDPAFAAGFGRHAAAGHVPARVVAEERGSFTVHDGMTTRPAAVSGRLRHESNGDALAFPAVGDWVAMARTDDGGRSTIHAVLERRSVLVRRAPTDHRTVAQIIAANVDVVFIVSSLNDELNLRRLERYLAVAWESGGLPVIVLSKADLDDDRDGHRSMVEAVAPGVEVIVASALAGEGMEAVLAHLSPGRTVAFIGSSGVGKSTLVNALAGRELMTTSGIREDDARGHHTTTRRQLVPLATGLVIDTPGMRELALLDGEGLASAFDDIDQLATTCRFSDCGHRSEPGCAIRAAVADGSLDADRLDAFERLQREARRSERANDVVARQAERRKWTLISKSVNRHMREKYGDER
ncbi:MAG: ribosome small subunit-dependent GTPase A [Chloroflexota bacterium]|nr:MAG: ribosome small subunit-dependent GTPase A [Chloroflexota bacterium]